MANKIEDSQRIWRAAAMLRQAAASPLLSDTDSDGLFALSEALRPVQRRLAAAEAVAALEKGGRVQVRVSERWQRVLEARARKEGGQGA